MSVQVFTSTISLEQYARDLERGGERGVLTSPECCWRQGEIGSLLRVPLSLTCAPSPSEVRNVLMEGRAAAVSYLVEPDANHPPNAFLYVCRKGSYCLDSLSKQVRHNIRKANGALRFSWADKSAIVPRGFEAYRDSKLRNGLSVCTPELFRAQLDRWLDNPANRVVGAWKDDRLVAFYKVVAVNDWVETGGYSANEGLEFCPNNGLFHYLLTYFLVDRGFQNVCAGLSSIQEQSKAVGLHQFKLKVGFEAVPVRRVFVLNPFLRPFVNRLSVAMGHGVLKIIPRSRVMRKGIGVLAGLVNTDRHTSDRGSVSTGLQ